MVIAADLLEPTATAELLSDARKGNASAFCLLIEPLQARLLRQAVALAGDLSEAEDLVSEALVEGWKHLARYDGTCRLSTWLYAILLHRHQKAVQRARSRPPSLARLPVLEANDFHAQQQNLPATEPWPAEVAVQHEIFQQLGRCIELLPEKHRQVVRLRFFEDATLPDIASVLGCSVGTVKSRLHHALDKLRKMKMNLPALKGDQQA